MKAGKVDRTPRIVGPFITFYTSITDRAIFMLDEIEAIYSSQHTSGELVFMMKTHGKVFVCPNTHKNMKLIMQLFIDYVEKSAKNDHNVESDDGETK